MNKVENQKVLNFRYKLRKRKEDYYNSLTQEQKQNIDDFEQEQKDKEGPYSLPLMDYIRKYKDRPEEVKVYCDFLYLIAEYDWNFNIKEFPGRFETNYVIDNKKAKDIYA